MDGILVLGGAVGIMVLGGLGYLRARALEGARKWIAVALLAVLGAAIGASVGAQLYLLTR